MPRFDLVQTANHFVITVYCPNLVVNNIDVKYTSKDVKITITNLDPVYDLNFNLLNEIIPKECYFNIFQKKVEFIIIKKDKNKFWPTFEFNQSSITTDFPDTSKVNKNEYPTSCKKKFDFSKIEDEKEEESFMSFTRDLYSKAEPERKQAMIRSYTESNCTTLDMRTEKEKLKDKKRESKKGNILEGNALKQYLEKQKV